MWDIVRMERAIAEPLETDKMMMQVYMVRTIDAYGPLCPFSSMKIPAQTSSARLGSSAWLRNNKKSHFRNAYRRVDDSLNGCKLLVKASKDRSKPHSII